MFTGIVEIIGDVTELNPNSTDGGTTLTISSATSILTDCHLGDSISVNGTCLTVTSFSSSAGTFTVGIAPETLRRTNLGSLVKSSRVNLERAVRADTRMGGHFVQGHVDTIAEITERKEDGNAVTLRLRPRDKRVLRWVVEKGYVCLDGASLTVTKVVDATSGEKEEEEGYWEVMLISYTQERIVTAAKKVGESVNVEVDQIGKYVEKAVEGYFESKAGGEIQVLEKMVERIVQRKLEAATTAGKSS